MSDIFISYSRRDKAKAEFLANSLSKQGWIVWWDRNILPGQSFDVTIEQALDSSACVVVLWSKASVSSDWVKTEAAEGTRRGVLIPVLIDDVKIPLEFRRTQTANLSDWQGSDSHPEYCELLKAIAEKIRNKLPAKSDIHPERSQHAAEELKKKTEDRGRLNEEEATKRRAEEQVRERHETERLRQVDEERRKLKAREEEEAKTREAKATSPPSTSVEPEYDTSRPAFSDARKRSKMPVTIAVIAVIAVILAGSTVAWMMRANRTPKISKRFTIDQCGSIRDAETKLEWFVGPDRNISWNEATQWASGLGSCGGGWRMPAIDEIKRLYDPAVTAGTGYSTNGRNFPAHIDPVFNAIGGGSWVWSNESAAPDTARSFNLNQGKTVQYSTTNTDFSTRAFAVRNVRN